MKQRSTVPLIAGVVAVPLLLFAVYMGSYYAMVERLGLSSLGFFWYHAVYSIDSEALGAFFWPAHQLDLLIRPDYWTAPHSPVGGAFAPAAPASRDGQVFFPQQA